MDRLPRVLLVDDDGRIRNVLQWVLTQAGFEVMLAESGDRALEMFCEGDSIDVILTDLEMPGMHGSELIRAIRRLDDRVPIVVLTGGASGGLPEGASHRLDKPAKVDVLVEVLRDLIQLHSGSIQVGVRGIAKGSAS